MNREITQKEITLKSVSDSISSLNQSMIALSARIGDLPTRKELYDVESRLEKQIDDLAISTKNEFDRVHVRLGEMGKYTVEFREQFDFKANGFQNQLDNIYRSYPNRQEYEFLNKRMKKIEKVAFA